MPGTCAGSRAHPGPHDRHARPHIQAEGRPRGSGRSAGTGALASGLHLDDIVAGWRSRRGPKPPVHATTRPACRANVAAWAAKAIAPCAGRVDVDSPWTLQVKEANWALTLLGVKLAPWLPPVVRLVPRPLRSPLAWPFGAARATGPATGQRAPPDTPLPHRWSFLSAPLRSARDRRLDAVQCQQIRQRRSDGTSCVFAWCRPAVCSTPQVHVPRPSRNRGRRGRRG